MERTDKGNVVTNYTKFPILELFSLYRGFFFFLYIILLIEINNINKKYIYSY